MRLMVRLVMVVVLMVVILLDVVSVARCVHRNVVTFRLVVGFMMIFMFVVRFMVVRMFVMMEKNRDRVVGIVIMSSVHWDDHIVLYRGDWRRWRSNRGYRWSRGQH